MDKQECIERQLESALLEGRWGVFERLPSERGLAEAFGVNRATVRAALRALAGRGILETRRGSGTVVRALPGDARHAAGTFADYLAAFRILMPPLVAASLPAVSPSVILELERLLPSAGASLRNGDMKTFIQAQIRFFSILIQYWAIRASRTRPAASCLTVWRWRGCCRSARCPSARTCSRSWRGC